MSATGKAFETQPLSRRNAVVSRRWLAISSLLAIALLIATLIAYRSRRSPLERGTTALIRAFAKRRLIEPRLSGGFKCGEFRAADGDRTGIETVELDRARELIEDEATKDDPAAWLGYARLLLSEGEKLPEALKYLRRSLARLPESADAHNDLGVCLIQQGKLEDAIDEFEAALKYRTDMPEALFNRALCYQRLLLRDAANVEYGRLLEIERYTGWLNEIKQRQQEVSAPVAPVKKQAEIVSAFDAAFANGNIDEAGKTVDQNIEVFVREACSNIAIEYLKEAVAGNGEQAERHLFKIEFIGKRLLEAIGDASVIELANYLHNLPVEKKQTQLELISDFFEKASKLFNAQKYTNAQAEFERLSKVFAISGNEVFRVSSDFDGANCHYVSGRLERSIDLFKAILALSEKHQWPYRRALVFLQLGVAYSRLGQDSLAIKYCEQALQSGKGLRLIEAYAHQYMSNPYANLGDLDNALRSRRESTRLYMASVPSRRQIANNYNSVGELYRIRGNHRFALLYALESLGFSDQAKDNNRAAQASSFAAVEYARLNQFEQTRELINRAYDYLNGIETGQRTFAEQFVLTRAAELAALGGDHARAVKLYSDAEGVLEKAEDKTLSLVGVLRARAEAYARLKDFSPAHDDLKRAIDMIESYRAGIEEGKNRSDFLDASQSVFDQMISLNISALNRGAEAFNFSEQSRARTLLDEFSAQQDSAAMGKQVKPLKLEGVQKALPDDTRLLVYSVTNERTFLFLVTRSGFEIAQSPATSESLDHLVQEYVSSLKEKAPLEEVNEKSLALYEQLIAPVEERLRDGKTLCIAPDKALHFLPFAALRDRSGRYLIESCRLMYTPSASTFAQCVAEGRAKGTTKAERILAVGNPKFNRDEFPRLDNLPDAEREAGQSAGFYTHSVVLNGTDATEDRVKAALKDCDVAHLAVHCLVEEKSPWLAAIVLAGEHSKPGTSDHSDDGLFYLNEVYKTGLRHTRLVVLSACQSALGHYYRGEGIVSLVRPFLALRVPTIVASLWSVDSQATSSLMVEFHRSRKVGTLGAGDALRLAQIKMGGSGLYQHPYYWAPFIAVGVNN